MIERRIIILKCESRVLYALSFSEKKFILLFGPAVSWGVPSNSRLTLSPGQISACFKVPPVCHLRPRIWGQTRFVDKGFVLRAQHGFVVLSFGFKSNHGRLLFFLSLISCFDKENWKEIQIADRVSFTI